VGPPPRGGCGRPTAWTHLPQRLPNTLRLPLRLLREVDEPLVERSLLRSGRLRLAPDDPIERLQGPPHRAQAVAEDGPPACHPFLEQRLGPLDEARQHAHAVAQQPAVGRVMDGGLDHRRVHPQLARSRHLGLLGQKGDPVEQRLQRRRTDGVRPAQEGRIVRHAPEIDPREPAQHQGVRHALFCLCEAPAIQMLDHEQTQENFPRRGVAPMDGGQPVAPRQVGAYLAVELVVVEQAVEVHEHGVGLVREFGHAGEHILCVVVVDEHRSASSGLSLLLASVAVYHLTPSSDPAKLRVYPLYFAPQNSTRACYELEYRWMN
jgi:hypothetical protein